MYLNAVSDHRLLSNSATSALVLQSGTRWWHVYLYSIAHIHNKGGQESKSKSHYDRQLVGQSVFFVRRKCSAPHIYFSGNLIKINCHITERFRGQSFPGTENYTENLLPKLQEELHQKGRWTIKLNSVPGLSPRENYNVRVTAACRWS
jgi:hypothetical protein